VKSGEGHIFVMDWEMKLEYTDLMDGLTSMAKGFPKVSPMT